MIREKGDTHSGLCALDFVLNICAFNYGLYIQWRLLERLFLSLSFPLTNYDIFKTTFSSQEPLSFNCLFTRKNCDI